MYPKLKISTLTNLQDARYSAALGFDMLSFSLERGSDKKLPAPSVWSMVQWLDGPEFVLELNLESLDELQDLPFEPDYLSFPLEEWSPYLWNYGSAVILRGDASADVGALSGLLSAHNDKGKSLKFELSLPDPEALAAFREIFPHLLVHFPSLDIAETFIRSQKEKPFGISFREEAEEEPNLLHYERLDELMALYSDVHL